ncbi:hypothetical protein F5B21DRAFT_504956 [Xylaria acuta]|nr:hypothetical protein F5B21DRAFT_504956 [Xylaria acuta]
MTPVSATPTRTLGTTTFSTRPYSRRQCDTGWSQLSMSKCSPTLKIARQLSSKAFNPTYTFTLVTEEFSLGEVVAPVIAFGNVEAITVNRTLAECFFRNERPPTALGWKKREEIVSLETILHATNTIRNATKLTTGSGTGVSKRRLTRNPHFG